MQFWTPTGFMDTLDALTVAPMLDEAGFDGIFVSDHLIYPRELRSAYPSPSGVPGWPPDTAWPDTWVLTGALAAVTGRIRFSNAVYIAPARPLLEVAKQVATAAVLSRGRASLAAGVGWMREEYELLGQDYSTRGKRLDEMIPALRALWQGGWVSWTGEYYEVPEMMMEPHPPQPVPILVGGESEAALRRAARLCDGWVGFAYKWDDAASFARKLTELRGEYGRQDEPFDIIVAFLEKLTPDLLKRAADVGITGVTCSPWAGTRAVAPRRSVEEYRAAIERFANTYIHAPH